MAYFPLKPYFKGCRWALTWIHFPQGMYIPLMFDTIPGTLMCKIHNFSHFLQRVHCVEVKSAVDVEMFTALPDSASSLLTATQTANGCTGHDARRRCSEYTMAVIFIHCLLGSVSPPRASFLGSFVACKQPKLEAKLASWSVHFTRPTACTRDEYGFNRK